MSANIAQTVANGIQEVSALLPLLGTEQCEEHTGSALCGGFCYVGITPISIFGSLGIVKAGFNVLIASIASPFFRFLGAEKLAYGGFKPKGDVAPMIAIDPKHSERFLAESRLEKLLEDEHIENAEDLTIEWDGGSLRWNFLMIALTILSAAVGITPYLYIILHPSSETHSAIFLDGWPFPIIRLIGSSLSGIVVQIIIQIRILIILKTRLVFMAIDRQAKELGVDLSSSNIRPWSTKHSSERCIWELERHLNIGIKISDESHRDEKDRQDEPTSPNTTDENSVANPKHCSVTVDDTILRTLERHLRTEMKKHFIPGSRLTRFIQSRTYFVLPLALAGGLVLSVAGYIGCFNLVQNAPNNSTGPVLWLALEIVLCLFRIVVWAANPSWDDSKGMTFKLKLVSHSPLVTCDLYADEIETTGAAPVVRANSFLDEVAAFTGPIPSFAWEDTALYYILTGKKAHDSTNPTDQSKILYLVVLDYKEQTSRLFVKRNGSKEDFEIFVSSLVPDPRSTRVSVKTKFKAPSKMAGDHDSTGKQTHFLTSNPKFMQTLSSHYDDVINRIRRRKQGEVEKKPFRKTWALKAISDADGDNDDQAEDGLAPIPSEFSLTKEDTRYLEQGQTERRWTFLRSKLENWIDMYLELLTKELLEDVPTNIVFKKDESVTIVQKYEANEVEFLIIEARKRLESFLHKTSSAWEKTFMQENRSMIETVLQGSFLPEATQATESVEGATEKKHEDRREPSVNARKARMSARLEGEQRSCLEHHARMEDENMHRRVDSQADEVRKRVQGRKYNDPEGENIMKAWQERLKLEDRSSRETLSYTEIVEMDPGDDECSATSGQSRTEPDARPSQHHDDAQEEDFLAMMDKRFGNGNNELRDINEGDEESRKFKKRSANRFQKMKVRCRERAIQLTKRLEMQSLEFRDAEEAAFLIDPSQEWKDKRLYWSAAAARERVRFLNRKHKYMKVSGETYEAFGSSLVNICRALKRSQEFAVIDFSDFTLEDEDAEELAAVVREVKSITGLLTTFSSPLYPAIITALRENISTIAQTSDVCSYDYVQVNDYYRRDYPYLIFPIPGHSRCTVGFRVQDQGDHILTLRHCVTTSKGKVDITLNGTKLEPTWGIAYPVMANFQNEDILLPDASLKVAPELNVLEIRLTSDSEGVYWLSDVFLPARKPSALKEEDEESPETTSAS